MKKRILALLLSASMVFSLAACSNNSANESKDPGGENTQSSDGVTIDLWSFNIGTLNEEANWDALIAEFNKVHPDINVNVEIITYTDGDTQLSSAVQNGSQPDILFEGPERIVAKYAEAGLMADLSDLWTDVTDIPESLSSVCQLDGKYYMMPLSVAAHCMAINYEVFEEAGALQYLDEETRTWTTDNFVKAMEAVRDSGLVATPGIIYCGAQGGDQGTRALVNNLYSDYFVNEDGTAYNMDSENNIKALELLKSMVDSKALSANASFAAADELQEFAKGTCAVTFCWNYSNYVGYAEQTQFTPFAMAFPSDDGTPELEMAGPYGFGVFDKGDDAKVEAAKTFIDFICNDQTAGTEAVKYTGFFPVHADWGDVYEGAEDAEFRAPFALMSDYLGRYYNLTSGWTEQRALWWNMLAQIMTLGTDVETAVTDYVTQANSYIG